MSIDIEVNGKQYFGDEGMIQFFLEQLQSYRDDGREPSQELLDDIASYEYILANGLAGQYKKWRLIREHCVKKPRHFPPFVASKGSK